jgi:hypothetical protein
VPAVVETKARYGMACLTASMLLRSAASVSSRQMRGCKEPLPAGVRIKQPRED